MKITTTIGAWNKSAFLLPWSETSSSLKRCVCVCYSYTQYTITTTIFDRLHVSVFHAIYIYIYIYYIRKEQTAIGDETDDSCYHSIPPRKEGIGMITILTVSAHGGAR